MRERAKGVVQREPSCYTCVTRFVARFVAFLLLLPITSCQLVALYTYHMGWCILQSPLITECLQEVCVFRKVEACIPDDS